jgi:hypothetical protein
MIGCARIVGKLEKNKWSEELPGEQNISRGAIMSPSRCAAPLLAEVRVAVQGMMFARPLTTLGTSDVLDRQAPRLLVDLVEVQEPVKTAALNLGELHKGPCAKGSKKLLATETLPAVRLLGRSAAEPPMRGFVSRCQQEFQ